MMVSHVTPTCEGFKARIAELMGRPMEIYSRETVRVMSVPVGKPGEA